MYAHVNGNLVRNWQVEQLFKARKIRKTPSRDVASVVQVLPPSLMFSTSF